MAAVTLALLISLAYLKWLEPRVASYYLASGLEQSYPGISGRQLIDDELQYLSIAQCVSTGAGYGMEPGTPTAVRVPVYPLYIAALFRLFSSSIEVALRGNALLVVLLPLLTFALALPAFGRKTAVIAAFVCALNPAIYYFGLSEAYAEAMFAVVLCAATVMWQRAHLLGPPDESQGSADLVQGQIRYLYALAAGVLFGVASLTRTGLLGLPFCIVLAEVIVQRKQTLSFKKAIVFCLASVLTVFPWALRNHNVLGAWIFSSTNDGVTLLGSVLAAQRNRGDWLNPGNVAPEYARVQFVPDSIDRDRNEQRVAMAELKKVPLGTWIKVVAKRVFRLWVPLNRIVSDEAGFKANVVVNLFYLPAMLLAVFGLWHARHNSMVIAMWTTCLYLTMLAAASWGSTRFRYGVEPFLAIFAAHGFLEAQKSLHCGSVVPRPEPKSKPHRPVLPSK
jgi:4-amino-4-deoxy-L-arabinose transferase-like glycosyltransferase